MAPLPTSTAISRWTKRPTYHIYYCTRQSWPLSKITTNRKFRAADRGWPAKAAQMAYNQWDYTHMVSGSSRQYDTISLPMTRPFPDEDNSKIIPIGCRYMPGYSCGFVPMATSILCVGREEWSIRLPWNGDDDQLEQMCSPSYLVLLEPRLKERAHPTSTLDSQKRHSRFCEQFLVLHSSLQHTTHPCECMRHAENLASPLSRTLVLVLHSSRHVLPTKVSIHERRIEAV